MATLDAIAAQPDQKNKIEQYKSVLQQTVSSGSVQECHKFADHSNDSAASAAYAAYAGCHLPTQPNLHSTLPQYYQTLCLWL